MASPRPLHELLGDLVGDADAAQAHGDPEAYLAANGHADLPPDLVAEAVVSYADTAPVEVAEHLAPYVTTHSAVPADEPPDEGWFDLLTTAPAEDVDPDADGADLPDDGPDDPWSADEPSTDDDPDPGLDFGSGSTDVLDAPSTADTPDTGDETDATPPADDHPAGSAWTDLEPETVGLDTVPEPADSGGSDEPDDSEDELD